MFELVIVSNMCLKDNNRYRTHGIIWLWTHICLSASKKGRCLEHINLINGQGQHDARNNSKVLVQEGIEEDDKKDSVDVGLKDLSAVNF